MHQNGIPILLMYEELILICIIVLTKVTVGEYIHISDELKIRNSVIIDVRGLYRNTLSAVDFEVQKWKFR